MHPRMAIAVSLDGYRFHAGMASWDGDHSIPGWRSMHLGMVIDESRDGDRCIPARDGDRYIPGWRSMQPGMLIIASRDGDLEMTVDASRMAIDTSREGNRSTPGWHRRSQHPGMASGDGDQSIPEWRSRMADSVPDWRSMHLEMVIYSPGMTIAASRDGDHFLPG